MASASQLYGLMKFLKRDEWREPFEEIRREQHFERLEPGRLLRHGAKTV